MKYFFPTILLLLANIHFRDKNDNPYQYIFDYQLDYLIINHNDTTKNKAITFYINSKDNDFYATRKFKDNKNFLLNFIDYKGKYSEREIENVKTDSAQQLKIGPLTYSMYANPYKYQVRNYDFFRLSDTLIEDIKCQKILLRSTRPKIEKKKKLWREEYVIDTSKNFMPLLPFSTAFEIWKSRKNIPNGLVIRKLHYNEEGNLIFTEILKEIRPINLQITLVEN